MDLTGKLLTILAPVSGEGRNGTWKKQEFILEIPGDFPKKLCIANWNDKADLGSYKEGETVKVYFDVESREYNGKWYTDVKVWKMERPEGASAAGNKDDALPAPPDYQAPPPSEADEVDDLPF